LSTMRSCMRLGAAREGERRGRRRGIEHARGDELAERGTHLEPVPRARADDPRVRGLGMAIEDVVPVRAQLVLAHAGLEKRRGREGGKAPREIAARGLDASGIRHTVAVRWIERRARRVVADLEPAPLGAWYAVEECALSHVDPHGEPTLLEATVARGR